MGSSREWRLLQLFLALEQPSNNVLSYNYFLFICNLSNLCLIPSIPWLAGCVLWTRGVNSSYINLGFRFICRMVVRLIGCKQKFLEICLVDSFLLFFRLILTWWWLRYLEWSENIKLNTSLFTSTVSSIDKSFYRHHGEISQHSSTNFWKNYSLFFL